MKWMMPGQVHFTAYSTGASADIRVAGAASLLYTNNRADLITGELPADWSGDPVTAYQATYCYVRQVLFPRWRNWA